MNRLRFCIIFFGVLLSAAATGAVASADAIPLSDGQTVYVAGYSHIYSGDRERPMLLAVTVSIRNTDLVRAIVVNSVDYIDSGGKLVKQYVTEPVVVGPMGSIRYVVPESDKAGGSGANFVVRWKSAKPVNPPIIESIMIGTQMQQGISFTSRGQQILEHHD
ncbi:MAG: DUF3124 domain-containing protein [Desulfobacterales bacterium]|nr:DUF3124 domain-containing protein [Desulfobacterales bacterium]MCF8078640.1 DUF3124 domain-containing protein [Desulfobacterales bacterium]